MGTTWPDHEQTEKLRYSKQYPGKLATIRLSVEVAPDMASLGKRNRAKPGSKQMRNEWVLTQNAFTRHTEQYTKLFFMNLAFEADICFICGKLLILLFLIE